MNKQKVFVKNIIMDIVCRKQNCLYNKGTKCYKKEILVDELPLCTDYDKVPGKPTQDISKNMLVKSPKIAPYRSVKNMDILCKADCVHNKSGKCMANGIIVNSVSEKPECISFVKN